MCQVISTAALDIHKTTPFLGTLLSVPLFRSILAISYGYATSTPIGHKEVSKARLTGENPAFLQVIPVAGSCMYAALDLVLADDAVATSNSC